MILLAFLLGAVTGFATGLVPGIHVNLAAAFLAAAAPAILQAGVDPLALGVFVVAAALVHTLAEIVPTLFLGVPGDEAYALLPGHRLVRSGQGGRALRLSLTGSLRGLGLGLFVVGALLSLETTTLEQFAGGLRDILGPLLIIVCAVLVATDERPLWALFVLLTSGFFGLIIFATPLVPGGPVNALFPALTGLFGASGLVLARNGQTSHQLDDDKQPVPWLPALTGGVGGMVVGLLPGLGSGNVATLFTLGRKERDSEGYLVTTGAINAADALFGIAALVLIDRARSGASVALETFWQPTRADLVWLCAAALMAALLARHVLLRATPFLLERLNRLDHPRFNRATLTFLGLLVLLTTGLGGLLIFACGASLGLVAPVVGCRRAQAMGLFLVPTILFFTGTLAPTVSWLGVAGVQLPPATPSLSWILFALSVSLLAGLAAYRLRQ